MTKLKAKKKPKAKKTVQQKQKQAQKQTVIVQIGQDGLKKPTKRRRTKAPAPAPSAPAPSAPAPAFMSPIYIPPQPVPIIRQKIRNQADIQEQLRAYDQQQQALVGANAAAFDANNIGRKNVLYPTTPQAEEEKIEIKPPEPEIESPPSPPAQPATPEQQPELLAAAEEPEQRGLRPPARGRPRGVEKTVDELKAAIRVTGNAPVGLATMRKPQLQAFARKMEIDLMR